ncbi:MAG: primosomal protein DnaI [Vulcanibacillus sp.]
MNSIRQVIEELMPNLAVESKNILEKVIKYPEIKTIIVENKISEEKILPSLNLILQYIEESNNCKECKNINNCPNLLAGHYSVIEYTDEQFQLYLKKCDKRINKDKEDYKNKLFKNQFIPDALLKATFGNFDGNSKGRADAFTALLEFCDNFKSGAGQKGIYLYGPLGVGKSYMMVALAKKMAEKNISTLMVYVPDFFREMKQSINDNSINEKIQILKNVQVLILDDIGAETISQWERDEILGSILQARMVKELPTMYTSNLNYDALEEHFRYSNKGGEEGLKALRIMERIRHYTDAYFVDGLNRRKL